jgi:hypothetical protein
LEKAAAELTVVVDITPVELVELAVLLGLMQQSTLDLAAAEVPGPEEILLVVMALLAL